MMQKIQRTLADWQELEATTVPLVELETTDELQPRTPDAVPYKYRARLAEASDEHVRLMLAVLAAYDDRQLEPLLVAKVDGRLLVVDGHHRLAAYQQAGRQTVQARVLTTDDRTALMVSKLVNNGGAKLAMHADQRRDAAWQFIAEATERGRKPLALSLRQAGALFGVGKSTIDAMVKRLSDVNPVDFDPAALDPGTRWPRWRYVRGNAWRDALAGVSPERMHRASVTRTATKLGKLLEAVGTEVMRDAAASLRAERGDEVPDQLDAWIDAEADANGGLAPDY